MLRLARAPNIAIAALWVDLLRQAGFDASLQRYFLGAAAGELPPDQCLPEVWIADRSQEAAARELLAEIQSAPPAPATKRRGSATPAACPAE